MAGVEPAPGKRVMAGIERDAAAEPRAPGTGAPATSLLGALVIVARQHGIQLSVPQLVHDHLLEPDQPSVSQLLSIAAASGLRATSTWLGWSDLFKLGKALPAVVLLRNGNAMVLREAHDNRELPRIVLQDPNAHEDAPLILDEPRFMQAWTGETLLFKRDYSVHDEDQPFGLKLIVAVLLRDKRIARDIAISAF